MGWLVELTATEITISNRRGWQPPKGGVAPLLIVAAILAIIVAAWLGAVTIATGSIVVALFAASVLALIGLSIGMLIAKIRATRPLIVRARVTADGVIFDAGNGARSLMRWLAPVGVLMLASLVALLVSGELYGDSGEAVFSGVGRFGSVAFFAIGAAIILPGIRAWRGSGVASLTLTPATVSLALPRTGGSAEWPAIGGATFAAERASVLANTGTFSWASRDLASDPVVLTELITYYAENPAARATIGSGTIALLQSGRF